MSSFRFAQSIQRIRSWSIGAPKFTFPLVTVAATETPRLTERQFVQIAPARRTATLRGAQGDRRLRRPGPLGALYNKHKVSPALRDNLPSLRLRPIISVR